MSQHDRLRETLELLRVQLDSLQTRDPEATRELSATIAQVQEALAGESDAQREPGSLVKQMQEGVLRIEAEHPTLAGLLTQLVDVLAQLGI